MAAIHEIDLGDHVVAGVSGRAGGVSDRAFASLNLSFKVGDDPDRVRANRRRLAEALGHDPERLVMAGLVHGAVVTVVGEAEVGRGALDEADVLPSTDALVTDQPGAALAVTVADCAPVLLADPSRPAVGVAHAGWRGAVARVAQRTVEAMVDRYGTDPAELRVAIGPHIGLDSFEVGPEVAQECAAAFPSDVVVHLDRGPKPHADLTAMLLAQLRDAGVDRTRVTTADVDTVTDDRFFSHRRAMATTGATGGRMAGVIRLR